MPGDHLKAERTYAQPVQTKHNPNPLLSLTLETTRAKSQNVFHNLVTVIVSSLHCSLFFGAAGSTRLKFANFLSNRKQNVLM